MTAVPTSQSSTAAASATSAVQTPSANSPSSSTSQRTTSNNPNHNGDSLFEPSVEMMVNDFDDERTLEEEEALAATEAEDPSTELSNLQRVSLWERTSNFGILILFLFPAGKRYANRRTAGTVPLSGSIR